MPGLCVNIDHIATVRQARRADEPDPVWAAVEAELGGADGVTFHLREDRRHINDRDAEVLKRVVAGKLNMEMSIAPEIVKIACQLKPTQCTLVPERRQELTTEGGLHVVRQKTRIKQVVKKLRDAGMQVSAFIEPDRRQVDAAANCGFDAVELWTGGWANAADDEQREAAFVDLVCAARDAREAGLAVYAGHGLTYRNIGPLAACLAFEEFNIGHGIVARASIVGMRTAVEQMRNLIERAALSGMIGMGRVGDPEDWFDELFDDQGGDFDAFDADLPDTPRRPDKIIPFEKKPRKKDDD